jgi:hypothetical protein
MRGRPDQESRVQSSPRSARRWERSANVQDIPIRSMWETMTEAGAGTRTADVLSQLQIGGQGAGQSRFYFRLSCSSSRPDGSD